MQNGVTQGQAAEGAAERLRALLSKLTWKHALVGAIPLLLYLYPRPILRLFMPITAVLNRNHPPVACHHLPRELILTTNPALTRDNLNAIETLRGTPPDWTPFRDEEVVVIEIFPRDTAGDAFRSQSAVLAEGGESELTLYCEQVWTSYRLARLQNPELKAVLIKSSEAVLKNFLLRFYKMDRAEQHKIGFFTEGRLSLLRLDQRVGTYEHLTCEFALPRHR